MQRRYLRRKYGAHPSIVNNEKAFTGLWHFGASMNVDKLLGVESKQDPPSWDSVMTRPLS